jgi:hypothetical protein
MAGGRGGMGVGRGSSDLQALSKYLYALAQRPRGSTFFSSHNALCWGFGISPGPLPSLPHPLSSRS